MEEIKYNSPTERILQTLFWVGMFTSAIIIIGGIVWLLLSLRSVSGIEGLSDWAAQLWEGIKHASD